MLEEYRFVYASSLRPEQRTGFYNQLVKSDIETGQTQSWFEPDCYPGEPVFVGRPDRRAEDEGVILAVVLDAARAESFLLVLDAQSFVERARAAIPYPVLFGYHGEFFEEE
jgi:carotenoid cleavage dioxygenase-like enzyme